MLVMMMLVIMFALTMKVLNLFAEAIHCPASSDVRALVTKPPPKCQSETIMKLFDENFVSEASQCTCCFSCIQQHGLGGCETCCELMEKYFPRHTKFKVSKSVAVELKLAIEELFAALGIDTLLIEGELGVTTASFAKDFIKCIDEIKSDNDIVEMWRIDPSIARELFLLFKEVVYGGDPADESDEENEYVSEPDEVDESCD